ncbi:MAG: DUF4870 domain-containing protein [Dermabacter sp.]|nr:DUF4870 domain-containing protein [Dermabacter sp.]
MTDNQWSNPNSSPNPGDAAPNDPYAAPASGAADGGQPHPGPQQGGAYVPPAPGTPGGPQVAPAGAMQPADERTWAVIAHLSLLVATLISAGFLGWLAPLVIFLVFKDRSPFIRQASAGAFNFSIILTVASIVAWTMFALGSVLFWLVVPILFVILAIIMWLVIFVATIVVPILAAMAANRGQAYRYPLTPTILR